MNSNSKINLVVIAKANSTDDVAFYELLLKHDSHLREKAHVHIFSSVADFLNLVNNVNENFSFVLFIHKGAQAANPNVDGFIIEHELVSAFGEKIKYSFVSREPEADDDEVFALDLLVEDFDFNIYDINTTSDLIRKSGKTKPSPSVTAPANQQSKNDSVNPDVAIITALFDDEHQAFDNHMKTKDVPGEKNLKRGKFLEAKSFTDDFKDELLLAWQQDMGSVDAGAFSSRIIAKFNPKYLVLAGVCGGRKEDVNLYDIIIPRNITDYMSGKFKKGNFIPRPLRAEPNQELINFLASHREQIINNMRLLASSIQKSIINNKFNIHFKNYACGALVVKTDGELLKIAQHFDDDIVGLEMESLGVIRASNLFAKNNHYGLVIKSVMDFTDEHKSDGDKGMIKTMAADMSYLCTRAILPLLRDFEDPKS